MNLFRAGKRSGGDFTESINLDYKNPKVSCTDSLKGRKMGQAPESATTRRAPDALPMFAWSQRYMVFNEEGCSIEPRSCPCGQLAVGNPISNFAGWDYWQVIYIYPYSSRDLKASGLKLAHAL